ncbi:MAG: galactosyldiacylglycerol synthase [Methylibium sp. NZG]|nr:MAG: galactosyldiacylglycerol synthase [Methylibium sp. NZG]
MTTIDLVYFNAGGGHRASAVALQGAIRDAGMPWQVRLVNLFEVLDPRDAFHRFTGLRPEDYYNKRLATGWTLGLAQELKVLQAMIRLGHPTLVRRLQQHWLRTEPDMVVSLVPNFNRAMCEALASALPGVPYATVLTDLADHPPHFWIEPWIEPAHHPHQPQHFICGSARAVEQALAQGHPADRVHASSGMLIRPDFYRPPPADRAEQRRRLGLDSDRPTGLVMFGGHGAAVMEQIARELDDVPLVLVCGHNERLAKRLRALPASAPRVVLGFCTELAQHMQLCDFFIGKPGPGSLSEAVQQRLPVIVVRNALTLPQERYNAQWVLDNGVGLVLPSFRQIAKAVAEMTTRLNDFRAATARLDNRAVFELPVMLAGILEASRQVAAEPAAAAERSEATRPATALAG